MKAIEPDAHERQLIEAAQRDPSRFGELYESNFDRVYAFVARRVPSREEAEELTAEVFHQALAGLTKFEWQGTPFAAWLVGIASHLIAHPTDFVSKDQATIALARALIPTKPDEARKLLDPLRTRGDSVGQIALTLYGELPAK